MGHDLRDDLRRALHPEGIEHVGDTLGVEILKPVAGQRAGALARGVAGLDQAVPLQPVAQAALDGSALVEELRLDPLGERLVPGRHFEEARADLRAHERDRFAHLVEDRQLGGQPGEERRGQPRRLARLLSGPNDHDLLAFSCKGRGFCPSCGGRRMAESAAHLVDHVLPWAPVRQWVLSFPWAVRYVLARRPALCAAVRRVFLRAVFGFYRDRAAGAGLPAGRTGAVNRIQRFGSALNLNVHFHALVLDGVYTAASPLARPEFHAAPELTERDVQRLVETIRARVLRLLRNHGWLTDEGTVSLGEEHEHDDVLPLFQAASIQGRVAQGPHAGAPLQRLNRIAASDSRFKPPPLCAEVDGFSLHAAVRISADERDRLEHLCRYVARPPFAAERLSLATDGRVVHELRRAWRDGTTHIVFDPLVFLERLAALVPPPRAHQQTYHGVLAPSSSWRDDVVIAGPASRRAADAPARPPHRYLWSELMRRVFGVDVLRCSGCRSWRRLVALITERSVIVRILAHLGLETDPPPVQPARAPPQLELAF